MTWQEEAAARDEEDRAKIRRQLAGEEIRPSRAAFLRDLEEPPERTLAQLNAITQRHRELFGGLACRGEIGLVARCSSAIESTCPQRAANGCPKRVLDFEATIGQCKSSASTLQRAKDNGVPAEIARMSLGGLPERRESNVHVEEWWGSQPRIRPRALVIFGPNLAGKSVAAGDLATRFDGRFVHLPTQHSLLRRDAELERLRRHHLVVFDELGAEPAGFDGDVVLAVAGLFCARVDAGLFTLVTTNLLPAEIRSRYSARVAERLNVHGTVVGVT